MAVHIDAVPEGEAVSGEFDVTINGLPLPVHEARVSAMPFNRRWPGHQRSADQSETACFASFATDGPAEVRIVPKRRFQSAAVRPLSKGISPETSGGAIAFTLREPGGYTVELDGFHNALHLFADPVKAYGVDPAGRDTLYFGPGLHDAGRIEMKSGQTVFIDGGAIVYACINARDAENIRILGRGILDNSRNVEEILFEVDRPGDGGTDVGNSRRANTILLENVRNAEIDGITIRDSLVYNVAAFGCEGLLIDNVKTIGCWRYNSDGIDLHNCSHCVVRNCFVRTYDDSICVKGHLGYPQVVEDILVENCTIWCDWGRALEIGAETCAEQIRGVVFRDCDIIRATHVAMDVQNVDYGDVHDVRFEDIRVEYDPVSQRPRMQESDGDRFVDDPGSDYMPLLIVSQIYRHHEYSAGRDRRGKNHDIAFRRISVSAGRMPPSSLSGYDGGHRTSDVEIEDLRLNGQRLATLEEANIEVGRFTNNIILK